jgi:hypothetical protein
VGTHGRQEGGAVDGTSAIGGPDLLPEGLKEWGLLAVLPSGRQKDGGTALVDITDTLERLGIGLQADQALKARRVLL